MSADSDPPEAYRPPPEVDLEKIRTVPVDGRLNKVSANNFAGLPEADGSFNTFLNSLPQMLEAESFRAVARWVAGAARKGRGVLWMVGGHTIKTGLAPLFIQMMDRIFP